MKSKDGFVQAYNPQDAVDAEAQIIVAHDLTQSPVDSGQLVPMTDAIETNLGRKPKQLSADAGYCSEANLKALEKRDIDAYVATGRARDAVAGAVDDAATTTTLAAGPDPTRVEAMHAKIKAGGHASPYRLRKQLPEPVFGQIKQARGFRQFLICGFDSGARRVGRHLHRPQSSQAGIQPASSPCWNVATAGKRLASVAGSSPSRTLMCEDLGSSRLQPSTNFEQGMCIQERRVCWKTPKFMLAAAVLVFLPALARGAAVDAGPFAALAGVWTGDGTISHQDGTKDRIRCRVQYVVTNDGTNLQQALTCSTDSDKFQVNSYVNVRDGSLSGNWTEVTRNVSGRISGKAQGSQIFINAAAGKSFSAKITMTTSGDGQSIDITLPKGTEVTDVSVKVSRSK